MFVFQIRGEYIYVNLPVKVGACDMGNIDVNACIFDKFSKTNLLNYELDNTDCVPEFLLTSVINFLFYSDTTRH